MIILAIETATMLGGLALMDSHEGLIAERRLNIRGTHSEHLMPELSTMLKLSGIGVRDLGAVAVSIGPGGFTGLRVGLSAAKGLCFSSNMKLVPVPTLEAIAHCMPFARVPVCPMMDARKGEVYTGLWNTSQGYPEEILSPRAVRAEEFAGTVTGHGEIIFLGQGAEAYRKEIESAFAGGAIYPPSHLMVPSPASVASLGLRLLEAGGLPDPISVTPRYLRRSEAEAKNG